MFFNLRLCRLFGVDIKLHSTLFLFYIVLAAPNVSAHGWSSLTSLTAYFFGLFASVLIHEYGHVFMARLHGVDCRTITLHGLGGLAHLEGELRRPRSEFLVAAAGPLVSFALAGVLWATSLIIPHDAVAKTIGELAFLNILFGCFNLLPAYPMDGGQMLHAVIWAWSREVADIVCGLVSRVLGFAMIALGLYYGMINLAIIGVLLFVFAPSLTARRKENEDCLPKDTPHSITPRTE